MILKIQEKAAAYFPEVQAIRHHIHAHPELSFKETETARYLSTQLIKHRIEHQSGISDTGIVALIEGKNPNKKCVLLRGDMDALPIPEKNDVPYRSVHEGIMHACGHDVHSTCVLGAAIILQELRDQFEGTVKIMFQPGEELLPGGASLMIAAGVLENPKVDVALALHVYNELEAGQVGFKSGMYMASTDEIYIDIIGKGGHAAMPASYNSPLLVAAEVLLALEQAFPNEVKAQIPTVLAFGRMIADGATNVIPEKVSIAGTFRTMDEKWRAEAHKKIKTIAGQVASGRKAQAEVKIVNGYPFLVNNEALTLSAKKIAAEYLGEEKVFDLDLRMTAEDFAFISQKVPACFFRLGTGNKEKGISSGVHTATFNIDEKAIETGASLLAGMAIALLQE